MSDSLPADSFSGALRVLKLTSGEELISLVSDIAPDQIKISCPALLENYISRDEKNNMVEYVKLTNYLANIKGYEIILPKTVLVYMGMPNLELEKMYEVYFMTLQTDPKSIAPSSNNSNPDVIPGLQLLNDLFTNEDFVNFVNEMMDQFEGVESVIEIDEDIEIEGDSEAFDAEEPETPPKKKKRKAVKPETNNLPYNPEKPPENPESWSDNPEDYL
jgi:hypothetical protein